MSADLSITGPQYHPRSVRVAFLDGNWCYIDGSLRNEDGTSREPRVDVVGPTQQHRLQAEAVAKVRRRTIKGALTRRANKARAAASALDVRRAAACAEAGVTWAWLTTGDDHNALTPAEADAWLGLDR